MMWGVITPEATEGARAYWREQTKRQQARKAGLPVEPRRRGRPRKWMRVPYVAPVAPVAPASTPVTPNPWVTGPAAAAKLTGTK
jgi:hypothetical protein